MGGLKNMFNGLFRKVLISSLTPVLALTSVNSFADLDPNKVIDYTGSGESLGSWSFESNDSFASNDSMGSQNSLDNMNSFNRPVFDVKCVSSLGRYDKYLKRYKRSDTTSLVNPNIPTGSDLLARRVFLPYWNKLGEGTYDRKQDKVTFTRPGFKTIVCNASTRPQTYFWFDGFLNGINRLDRITPKSLNFRVVLKPWERLASTSSGAIAITWNDYTSNGSYYNVRDYWLIPKVRDAYGREVIARYEITGRDTVRLHVLTRERIHYPLIMRAGFVGFNKSYFPQFAKTLTFKTLTYWDYLAYKKHHHPQGEGMK